MKNIHYNLKNFNKAKDIVNNIEALDKKDQVGVLSEVLFSIFEGKNQISIVEELIDSFAEDVFKSKTN